MAQPLSIENEKWTYLITTRTAGSRLWLIGNKELEERILSVLARYQEVHSVTIYSFVLMGNHYHLLANFPKRNRALFMRDFNSAVARLVGRYAKQHGRRSVWARRYGYQVVVRDEDIHHWFMYIALNPVSSGLVPDIEQYSSYNSIFDAHSGRERKYKWIDWTKYLLSKRSNNAVKPEDFSQEFTLRYSRLPGFDDLSAEKYEKIIQTQASERQKELIKQKRASGRGFLGIKKLKLQKVGSKPLNTKTSDRHSFRPLVLTLCAKAKKELLNIYFNILSVFKRVSEEFRSGNLSVVFPDGTYPPPRLLVN